MLINIFHLLFIIQILDNVTDGQTDGGLSQL